MTTSRDELRVFAEQNFGRHLMANRYPGRGIVVGRVESDDEHDVWVQIYWLMGRSEHSRNRRLVVDAGDDAILRTDARDPALVDDPTHIIYEAMLELPDVYIVTNGDHTRTIQDTLERNARFEDALAVRERENDPPHYTPRISAMLDLRGQGELYFAILRANAANPDATDRIVWRLAEPPVGLGYGITTYRSDGDPLPSYQGDPLWLPLNDSPDEIADTYWHALDEDNRIALAVKVIRDGASWIILRHND